MQEQPVNSTSKLKNTDIPLSVADYLMQQLLTSPVRPILYTTAIAGGNLPLPCQDSLPVLTKLFLSCTGLAKVDGCKDSLKIIPPTPSTNCSLEESEIVYTPGREGGASLPSPSWK